MNSLIPNTQIQMNKAQQTGTALLIITLISLLTGILLGLSYEIIATNTRINALEQRQFSGFAQAESRLQYAEIKLWENVLNPESASWKQHAGYYHRAAKPLLNFNRFKWTNTNTHSLAAWTRQVIEYLGTHKPPQKPSNKKTVGLALYRITIRYQNPTFTKSPIYLQSLFAKLINKSTDQKNEETQARAEIRTGRISWNMLE